MIQVDTKLRIGDFFHQADFKTGNELIVIFGPSGAGKSVTLNILAGLIQPDSGVIKVGDKVFFDSAGRINLPPQKRQVGYVFQDYGLFPHLSVAKNIAFGLARESRSLSARRVEKMLKLMRLERLGGCYPNKISGGQRQRVALARALILEPSMLLLDEPFSALDSAVREKLRLDLLKIKEQYNIPIVFVTHDLEEAYLLADRMIVFDRGQILQIGTRDEVFYQPKDRTVARFVGAKNIFSGRVTETNGDDCRISTDHFQIKAPSSDVSIDDEVEFCIRPEDVMIVRPDRDLSAAVEANIFAGKIISASRRGATYQLEFLLDEATRPDNTFDFTIRVPAHAYQRLGLSVGCPIRVSLKKPAIHLLPKEKLLDDRTK